MTGELSRYAICLCFVVALIGCKKEDDGKSGVSGRLVASEGSAAGSIVRLFPAPEPFDDVSVWSVPNDEDAVGFAYDLDFVYDHRVISSVYSDTAGQDGEFQIEEVAIGDYVVVADHPNGGWTPNRMISVAGDVEVGDLQLPRVRTFSIDSSNFLISTNTTWSPGTQYVVRDNLFVDDGVTLTIEPGTTVLIAGNKAIYVFGSLVCRGTADNFIVFAAADVVSRDPDEWLQLEFSSGSTPPDIAYTAFRHGATAIASDVDSGVVEFCSFDRFVNEGVLALRQPPVVRRCVFNRTATGIRAAATEGFLCERNVFQTCDPFAIVLDTFSDGEIYCNWFRDCGGSDTSGSIDRGVISLDLISDTEIHHNFFETSWYAIAAGSFVDSTVLIHHNRFDRVNRVIDISVTEERRGPSNPKLNYNCFTSIDLRVVFVNCNQHNSLDMDATRNFWSTTSISTIQQVYVNDRNDDPICPTVFIEPVLASCGEAQTLTGSPAGLCQ